MRRLYVGATYFPETRLHDVVGFPGKYVRGLVQRLRPLRRLSL